MPKGELLTEALLMRFTLTQKKKLEKLADSNVLPTATFTRQQLVKTLKLQDS